MDYIRSPFRARKNSAGTVFQRDKINTIEGSNIVLTIADDPTDNEIDLTVAVSATPTFTSVTLSGFTEGSVLFANSSGAVAEDNTALFFDSTKDALAVGQKDVSIVVNSGSLDARITSDMSGDLVGFLNHNHTNTASVASNLVLAKSRGTHGTPTIVQDGDTLGILAGYGYSGNSGVGYLKAAEIQFLAKSGSYSTTSMPGQIKFLVTPDTSVTPTEALRLESTGAAVFTGTIYPKNDNFAYSGTGSETVLSHSPTISAINVTSPGLVGWSFGPDYQYTTTQTYGFLAKSSGFNVQPTLASSGLGSGTDSAWFTGADISPLVNTTGPRTWETLSGLFCLPSNAGAEGTVTQLIGGQFWPASLGTGTASVTTLTGVQVLPIASGLVTNYVGIDLTTGIVTPSGTSIDIYQRTSTRHSRLLGLMSLGADATPTAQLDITTGSTTRPVLRLIGIASQNANYMLIENSAGTDLFLVDTNGNIELRPDNYSPASLAAATLIDLDSTITPNFSSAALIIIDATPTVVFDQTASTTRSFTGFNCSPTLKNVTTESDNLGLSIGFDASFTLNNDTATIGNTAHYGFRSKVTTTTTGGNAAIYTLLTDFLADAPVFGSIAIPLERIGLQINSSAGPGSIFTAQTGILINDLTNATVSYSLRVLGTTAHSRHVPDITFGSDTTPSTAYVYIAPDARSSVTTEKSSLYGAAQTHTLTSATTVANMRQFRFTAPVINGVAGGGTETVTTASTVYISGEPTGSNVTFTNGPYALFVDSGITRLDAELDVRGKLMLNSTNTVSLTADNQVVTVGDSSYISISSNNATAANRTFVLTQSTKVGHILVLVWTGTNAGELVDDSAQNGGGNHRLAGTWTPTQYDILTLMSTGTDWHELSRSAN